jgi:hypothetical protein
LIWINVTGTAACDSAGDELQRELPVANANTDDAGDPIATDKGYLHLTTQGWVRADAQPFPHDRIETWRWEMERPANDAKERDRLTRVWVSLDWSLATAKRLRAEFGEPVAPTADRVIDIQCVV